VVMYVTNQTVPNPSSDNSVISASQTERIEILRQALDKQGVVSASNTHYDLLASVPVATQQSQIYPTANATQPVNDPPQPRSEENEDLGVYL